MESNERKYCATLFEIYCSISTMIYFFMTLMLVIFSAHGINSREHPKAFLFPPSEWNLLVLCFVLPPLFTATILFAFSLAQKFSFQNRKESPSGGLGGHQVPCDTKTMTLIPVSELSGLRRRLELWGGFYSCFNFLAENPLSGIHRILSSTQQAPLRRLVTPTIFQLWSRTTGHRTSS